MTKEMSPGEHLKWLSRALEDIQGEIDKLAQQVALLNQRIKRLEDLVSEQPKPTWPLDSK